MAEDTPIHPIKQLIPPSPFLLCVSGGSDSIACSHFLKNKLKLTFSLFHFNNKFIPEDDRTEENTRRFAESYGIPIFVETCQEQYEGGSKEDWCRKQRYTALQRAARKTKINHALVCHNLDDCVHSYLLNCLNGTPEYLPIPLKTQFEHVLVTRPFLLIEKDRLIRYCYKETLLQFVTPDPLNNDLDLRRNWVRETLLPVIEQRYVGLGKIVKKRILNKLGR